LRARGGEPDVRARRGRPHQGRVRSRDPRPHGPVPVQVPSPGTVTAAAAPPLRLAMWSGPRNVSTAFMRSWENRPDTIVVDEPFYAHYLLATGIDHPGRDEVIAHHETD